ncbi:hypothetical protein Misp02_35890 [Microtetraspora sp. NBRC 16547]|nr:hypothetical protein Misp02_35890 [Microtetraspora sp. NBRC 16547]
MVVRAGTRHLVAGVADRSTLYWTYRLRSRPVQDLSHGWGHNIPSFTPYARAMDTIFPPKLHKGDTIRVVAPALSRAMVVEHDHTDIIEGRFADLGLTLS